MFFTFQAKHLKCSTWNKLASRFDFVQDSLAVPLLPDLYPIIQEQFQSGTLDSCTLRGPLSPVEFLEEQIPLYRVFQEHLEVVQLQQAAVEHVQLDQILSSDSYHVIEAMQMLLHQLEQLHNSLYRSLKICKQSPLQDPMTKILNVLYHVVDYDSRVARAVRTIRHTMAAQVYLEKRMQSVQRMQLSF